MYLLATNALIGILKKLRAIKGEHILKSFQNINEFLFFSFLLQFRIIISKRTLKRKVFFFCFCSKPILVVVLLNHSSIPV